MMSRRSRCTGSNSSTQVILASATIKSEVTQNWSQELPELTSPKTCKLLGMTSSSAISPMQSRTISHETNHSRCCLTYSLYLWWLTLMVWLAPDTPTSTSFPSYCWVSESWREDVWIWGAQPKLESSIITILCKWIWFAQNHTEIDLDYDFPGSAVQCIEHSLFSASKEYMSVAR